MGNNLAKDAATMLEEVVNFEGTRNLFGRAVEYFSSPSDCKFFQKKERHDDEFNCHLNKLVAPLWMAILVFGLISLVAVLFCLFKSWKIASKKLVNFNSVVSRINNYNLGAPRELNCQQALRSAAEHKRDSCRIEVDDNEEGPDRW